MENLPAVQGLLGGLAANPALAPIAGPILDTVNGIHYDREGMRVSRSKDRTPGDSGQWGTAFRWLGDNTEYGAYFMNYHSRTPFLSMKNASAEVIDSVNDLYALAPGLIKEGVIPPYLGAS